MSTIGSVVRTWKLHHTTQASKMSRQPTLAASVAAHFASTGNSISQAGCGRLETIKKDCYCLCSMTVWMSKWNVLCAIWLSVWMNVSQVLQWMDSTRTELTWLFHISMPHTCLPMFRCCYGVSTCLSLPTRVSFPCQVLAQVCVLCLFWSVCAM